MSWWHSREKKAIAKRVMTVMLVDEHDHLDLELTVLLMLDQGLPRTLPTSLDYDRKRRFGPLLEWNRTNPFHLVPLMRHRESEVKEAARSRQSGEVCDMKVELGGDPCRAVTVRERMERIIRAGR